VDPGGLRQTQTWQGPSEFFCVPPQTDYFHLFICVAIVAIYGDDVIEQQLATDQMLLHFGNLAMHMNGELVLRKVGALPWPVGPTLPIKQGISYALRPHPCTGREGGVSKIVEEGQGVLGIPCY
jgi:hypothetical protein